MNETTTTTKLVDAEGLLVALFEEGSRPSLRWLRTQIKRRTIPRIKLGRLNRFDPVAVRIAFQENFTIGTKPDSRNRTTGKAAS